MLKASLVFVLMWGAVVTALGQWDSALQLPPQFALNNSISNLAAGQPSSLWSSSIRSAPFPTNSFWQNYALKDGSDAEYIHPYIVQSKSGAFSFCYPKKVTSDTQFILQSFVADLSISCKETDSTPHQVIYFDDLSVTLKQGSIINLPLVRGSPYITLIFNEGTPIFSTVHTVLNITSSSNATKHRIMLDNEQTWVIYSSSPITISEDLTTQDVFSGMIRLCVLYNKTDSSESEAVLDYYSSAYPIAGRVNYDESFELSYKYEYRGPGELLMLSLPMHRQVLNNVAILPSLKYSSMDGEMEGVVGANWTLRIKPAPYGWYSSKGVNNSDSIESLLQQDVANLNSISTSSSYFYGKALARAARLALIAQEIQHEEYVETVRQFLVDNLSPWLEGNFSTNGIVYDATWGGLISKNSVTDSGADFGLGVYNDHHYHWGYFCYAGAVLAQIDSNWAETYKAHLYALVADFMSVENGYFPKMRHFDPWLMHSWAAGLTEFNEGRNQESSSEAVNAYYSASLVGLAYNDEQLRNLGLNLAAFESHGAKALWHIPSNSSIYDSDFVAHNRMLGVVWATKRDTAMWFAPSSWLECRLGIQIIPVTPFTEYLFSDSDYNMEVVEWALPALSRQGVEDGWRGFVIALEATYDPPNALDKLATVQEFDDGNSLSNMRWWIQSRIKSS